MLVLTRPMPFSSGFLPTDIAGLLVWCRGSSLSSLADGDPVGSWTDESGGARHLTQATAAKKPVYRATGGPSSLPCIDLDATDDIIQATFTVAWPTTTFIVLYQSTYTGGKIIQDGVTSGTMGLRQNPSSGNVRQQASANGASVALGLTTWGLVTCVYNGASSTIALNGNADTASNPGTGSPDGLRLGTADVSVAEVLLYNSALSASDQTSVKNYIKDKYSLW